MGVIQVLLLALLQGFTEFLPVSSSAHLILVPHVTGWSDQGLAFDIDVHVGTLLAVVLYFRRDLLHMARGMAGARSGGGMNREGRLAWQLLAATLPIIVVGFLLKERVEQGFRQPLLIATASILFALLLAFADRRTGSSADDEYTLSWRAALLIGAAQVLALVPGASRSGVTMTAGLLVGLDREASARFSFLLSIPVILAAGSLSAVTLLQSTVAVDWPMFLLGASASFLSAYACIHLFLKLIERVGMLPFVLYRLGLGVLLFAVYL